MMEDIVALRESFRHIRKSIGISERIRRSKCLWQTLQNVGEIPACVMLYWPMGAEVDTQKCIFNLQNVCKICLPRVETSTHMTARLWQPGEALERHPIGGTQPVRSAPVVIPEWVLVPGVVFSKNGARIGQGGGYYDRFLAIHAQTKKIGVCFKEQILDSVPQLPHDIKMNTLCVV